MSSIEFGRPTVYEGCIYGSFRRILGIDRDLMLQITQLKIASNPFAKGFRDSDASTSDYWPTSNTERVQTF